MLVGRFTHLHRGFGVAGQNHPWSQKLTATMREKENGTLLDFQFRGKFFPIKRLTQLMKKQQ
jgi:hypothetical protein